MIYIKILIPCFFISCSCSNNSNDSLITSKDSFVEEQVPFIGKPDTTVDSSISQPFLEAKIDTFTGKYTEKPLYNVLKSAIRKPVKPIVKTKTHNNFQHKCSDYSLSPLTVDEAMECSMYHWDVATDLLGRGEVDSSFQHCQRALALYENGSLFYLKAKLLNLQNHPSTALQAAEISLYRHDHWKDQDWQNSTKERCIALWALYKKYPSTELMEKIEKSCQE
jgi:hypothetical protein